MVQFLGSSPKGGGGKIPQISRRLKFTIAIFALFSSIFLSIYLLRPTNSYHETDQHFVSGVRKYKEKANKFWTSSSKDRLWTAESEPISATRNATLGFGDVMYISLPYRTDRQDAMNLLATYTDMHINLVPGILGDSIHDVAKPGSRPSKSKRNLGKRLTGAEYGCWRAHADAWRRVVDENIDTALILEDDIDWDVNIHDIMARLSRQMRNNTLRLEEPTEYEGATAPYGLDWDVLWLGHCMHDPNPDRKDLYVEYYDPDAPKRGHMRASDIQDFEDDFGVKVEDDNQKRILMPTYKPLCTMGYAVTRLGAQRLLYNIGYRGLNDPVDLEIINAHVKGRLAGYTVIPPIFNAWRIGGGKDSDIQGAGNTSPGRGNDQGVVKNLRNSARKAFAERYDAKYWTKINEKKTTGGKDDESPKV